jgi:hypothetical protein
MMARTLQRPRHPVHDYGGPTTVWFGRAKLLLRHGGAAAPPYLHDLIGYSDYRATIRLRKLFLCESAFISVNQRSKFSAPLRLGVI